MVHSVNSWFRHVQTPGPNRASNPNSKGRNTHVQNNFGQQMDHSYSFGPIPRRSVEIKVGVGVLVWRRAAAPKAETLMTLFRFGIPTCYSSLSPLIQVRIDNI